MSAPLSRQITATILTFTIPIWFLPLILFMGILRIYYFVYTDVCGWEL